MNKFKIGQLVKINNDVIVDINKNLGISNVGVVLGYEAILSIQALRVNLGQPNGNGKDFLLLEEYLEPASIEFDKLKDGMHTVLAIEGERIEATVYKLNGIVADCTGECIYLSKDFITIVYDKETSYHTTYWAPFEKDDTERFGLQIAEDF